MAIVYPISLPTVPAPRRSHITPLNASSATRSPFDFSKQSFNWQGAAWRINIEYPPMRRPLASALIAQLMKLKSGYGTFLFGDRDAVRPRGIATGTPLVKGASQVGDVLLTDGWTHSVSGIMLQGDYIQIGDGATARLFMVLDDAASDGSGNASLTVWPPMQGSRSFGDNAIITTVNAQTNFALDTDFGWDADEVSTYGLSLSATEVP